MKEPLISVIVPIYKVEDYLDRCVESIVNQTYKNLEILLVDDGSPDNCPRICDKWADKDKRIKAIHKKNGGLSDARNTGIREANGQFFFFIDSDDYISNITIKSLYLAIQKYNSDISECNIMYEYENGKQVSFFFDILKVYNTNYDIMAKYIEEQAIMTVVWNKLYKRELFTNIEFEFGRYHEDEFFTYKILSMARKLVHAEHACYYYTQRKDSIVNSEFSIKKIDALEGMNQRALFVKDNYKDLYFFEIKNMTVSCIGFYNMLIQNKNNMDSRDFKCGKTRIYSVYKKTKWDYLNFSKLDYKFKVLVVFFTISLKIGSALSRLLTHRSTNEII